MKEKSIQDGRGLLAIGESGVRFIEVNGEPALTSEELGRHLGFKHPVKAISNIYERNREELEPFCSVLNLRTEAGQRNYRVFFEQGIYIVCMLAKTEKAKRFRRQVAHLLKAVREKRVHEMMDSARREGALMMLELSRRVKTYGRDPVEHIEDHLKLREAGFNLKKTARFLRIGDKAMTSFDMALRDMGFKIGGEKPGTKKARQEVLPCCL